MKIKLCILLVLVMLATIGCTNEDATKSTLEKAGYIDITTGGYDFFGCGQDDWYRTKFEATNSVGDKVSGVVCCGLFKRCTIRY